MFLKVVQYLYSGKVTLGEMGATIELFKLADQLQIVQLQVLIFTEWLVRPLCLNGLCDPSAC